MAKASRYSFSGHESFACKSLWLKKGYDFIAEGNSFVDPASVVKLGVGKNMVSAIRFWMKSFGLTEADNLNEISDYIFASNTGKDPFAEDINTLWLLHYMLVRSSVASIYNLTFLGLQREKKEFTKDQLLFFIKRKCDVPEQKNVFNENTVKKDIAVMLHNYIAPENLKSLDGFSALLLDLSLLRNTGNETVCFGSTDPNRISPYIILFALLDMKGEDKTVSFDTLQELSLIFCLQMTDLINIIRSICSEFSNQIVYTDNSGIKNVQFRNEIDKFDVLNMHYK